MRLDGYLRLLIALATDDQDEQILMEITERVKRANKSKNSGDEQGADDRV